MNQLIPRKLFFLVCLLFLGGSTAVNAQDPSFSIYIDNPQGIGKKVFEFDVMVQASGATSAFELRTFQGGIWVNPAFINGGSISLQNLTASSQMTAPKHNGGVQWNSSDNFINLTANIGVKTISSCISTTVSTAPIRVARVRMTNTADFGCTTPDLKFNYVQNGSPLRFRTSVSWRASGCALNYDMYYPNRPYSGSALFNGELYSTLDGDGKSPVNTDKNDPGCQSVLNLTAFLEGFYIGPQTMASTLYDLGEPGATADQTDTILVELYTLGDTYNPFAGTKAVLHTNGTAKLLFANNNDISGNPFWIAVKHRNAVQTWSKTPLDFTSNVSYNFSTGQTQAFDDGFNPPMQNMGSGVFAFYGGDVNQDGTVDGADLTDIDNDNNIFAFGYNVTDCTGDGATDSNDIIIVDNNKNLFLFYAQP
ncbi:MAG: hypothetical protein EYC69_09680 [Bacteroidetes bacterium]|nr:MAG: hypothetical protein EYC69_09680 [Bacteroidota bacterium]